MRRKKLKPISIAKYFANGQKTLFDKEQLEEMTNQYKTAKYELERMQNPPDLIPANNPEEFHMLNSNNTYQLNSNLNLEKLQEFVNNQDLPNKQITPKVLRTISEYSQKPIDELQTKDALFMAQELITNFRYNTMSRSEYNSFNSLHNISRFGSAQHKILLAFASAYHNAFYQKDEQ